MKLKICSVCGEKFDPKIRIRHPNTPYCTKHKYFGRMKITFKPLAKPFVKG